MISTLITPIRIIVTVALVGWLLPALTHAGQVEFNFSVPNPMGDTDTIEELITAILNALIIIAIPIIVLMIIYAGFLYVTARGNADQLRKATTALTYAIIGGVLIIGAVAITAIISDTVAEFRT